MKIKFRAWDKKENKMFKVYGLSWHFGIFLIEEDGRSQKHGSGETKLMQYTGLKDKNGTEIYEEDIIESEEDGMRYIIHDIFPLSRFPQFTSSTPVSKNTKEFGVLISNGISENTSDDWVSNPEFYEVIGNTYENPELLAKPTTKESEDK